MNERAFHPGNVAAATAVVGGGLAVLMPEHAVSIVRLAVVTTAAAAGLWVLALQVPTTWWTSPFEGTGRPEEGSAAREEIDWLRARLSGRRQPIAEGPPLPPETLHVLKPLIGAALLGGGLDPEDPSDREAVRRALSPLTLAVLTSEPSPGTPWFRMARPDEGAVAGAVHAVLDDLEGLTAGVFPPPKRTHTRHPPGP